MGTTADDTDAASALRLGNRLRDKLTGAVGIAVARSEHLFGCTHMHIKQEKLDDKGRPYDSLIVDLARCEFVDEALGVPNGDPVSPGLGEHVRDSVTGFEGVVAVTTEYIYRPTDCCVESRTLVEGKPVIEWFVAARLQPIDAKEAIQPFPRGPGASTTQLPRT